MIVSIAASLAALSACGDSSEPVATGTVPNTATLPVPTTVGPKICVEATDVPAKDGKPTVSVPTGEAPTELVKTDLKEGTGAVAEADSKVKVQYVGVGCTTGKQFDASWDRDMPLDVTLGQGQVIPGWDQGIPGMKVGGQRMLVIPASLAYGAKGQGTDIPPNEPLVFVIDLLEVEPATAT